MKKLSPLIFLWLLMQAITTLADVEKSVDPRDEDPQAIEKMYAAQCAVCHGDRLQGTPQGVALIGRELKHGTSIAALTRIIAEGAPAVGMPPWSPTLSAVNIRSLAILIREQRAGFETHAFRVNDPLVITSGTIRTEEHSFRVETVVDNLDPLPYVFAPLPQGGFLLTEKYRGLSLVSAAGERHLVTGTPRISVRNADTFIFRDLDQSNGWMQPSVADCGKPQQNSRSSAL